MNVIEKDLLEGSSSYLHPGYLAIAMSALSGYILVLRSQKAECAF